MPIYEYLCRDCGSPFEKLVRRFDEAVACPSCAGQAVDKQLSVFAVANARPAAGFAACGEGACAGDGGCAAGPCGGGACGYPN